MKKTKRNRSIISNHERCAVGIFCAVLAFASAVTTLPAHAGTKSQGTKSQGTKSQGTKSQGTKSQGTKSQGTKSQGTKSQGTKSQGTKSQGTAWTDEWLWGTRLHGVMPASDGDGHQLVEVVGFRGDRVDILAWRTATGWRRESYSPAELVGLRWLEHRCHRDRSCPRVEYRIRAARPDKGRNTMPANGHNHLDTWLYDIESRNRSSARPSAWRPVCDRGQGGTAGGLFVDGHWQPDGAWQAAGYTFSCQSGVIAKCVRDFGYKPWKHLRSVRTGRAVKLGPLHRACVRAARADYCGDGVSHTRDGTVIDMFDRHGFNVREPGTGMIPEAGFSEGGAVWLQRPRYDWPPCAVEGGRLHGIRASPATETPITVYSHQRP